MYSIEALIISEFCWNENFGFPYKITLVNDLSEQLLISQLMPVSLIKRAFLMFTKLWQCSQKCSLDSNSKLLEYRGFIQSSKLWLNLCSPRWISLSLKRVSSFNAKGLWILNAGLNIDPAVKITASQQSLTVITGLVTTKMLCWTVTMTPNT